MNATWFCSTILLAASLSAISADSFIKSAENRARIEQALPRDAVVKPAKPRRLLIFTLNVGYGGHPSIAYANEAFTLMGRKTGAFETVVTDDPAVFQRETLKTYDAVFFNNNVGNCFANSDLRQNLMEFITGGGGLLGVHGTTVAFTRWPGAIEDWPEFGYLIGARGANHKDSDEHVWMKLDDPDHPVVRVFGGQGFDYRDEFFRPQGTYSRDRVRVLLSIDTEKTDVNKGQPRGNCYRADNDYAVAWIRSYGRGRVFYSTIAHNPYVFWDPKMLQFHLAAVQFALGDLPAPTTPSSRLTPAVRAQEKCGWRLGLETRSSSGSTLYDSIDKAAQLGLCYIGACGAQEVSSELLKNFGPELSDTELTDIRLRLEASGLRLVTYEVAEVPSDQAACRKLFKFGRKMGIETFIASPGPEALDLVEPLCEEFGINFAIINGDRATSAPYWKPGALVRATRTRSARVGACADVDAWLRSGVNPVRGVRTLGNRLITVRMQNLDAAGAKGLGRPAGMRGERFQQFLAEIQRLGIQPSMFGLGCRTGDTEAASLMSQSIEVFNAKTLELAARRNKIAQRRNGN